MGSIIKHIPPNWFILILLLRPFISFGRRGAEDSYGRPTSILPWLIIGGLIIAIMLVKEQISGYKSKKEKEKKEFEEKKQHKLEKQKQEQIARDKMREDERREREKELRKLEEERERKKIYSLPCFITKGNFLKSAFYEFEVKHFPLKTSQVYRSYDDALKAFKEIEIEKEELKEIIGKSKVKKLNRTMLLAFCWICKSDLEEELTENLEENLKESGGVKATNPKLYNLVEDNLNHVNFTLSFKACGKSITKTGFVAKEIFNNSEPIVYHFFRDDETFLLFDTKN